MEQGFLNQLRVFISSTFNDLQKERKYLAEVIFPAISNKSQQRGVEFCEIDLRWGVPDNAPVIKSCIKEIEFTHPYFIGIIGHSDGTVPQMDDFKTEYGVFDEYNKKIEDWISNGYSITEMEFSYGAIEHGDPTKAKFFWLDYCSHTCKQEVMYKALIEKGFEIMHCSSVKDLGEKIMSFLEGLLPPLEIIESNDVGLYSIRLDQVQTIKQHLQYYVDRIDIDFNSIYHFLQSDGHILQIVGKHGVGKSTIVARFLNDYHQENKGTKLIYHFYNGGYIDDIYYHFLLELEKIQGCTYDDFAETEGYIDNISMKVKFERFLQLLSSSNKKIIFIVDGLEHADYDAIKEIRSILKPFDCFKLIITSNNSVNDTYVTELHVAFPNNLIKEIITSYYRNYRRVFPFDIIKELDKSARKWNFYSLISFLNEIRVFGTYNNLSKVVDELSNCTDEQMYDKIISHWKDLVSSIEKKNIVETLALSHYGLTENTIKKICGLSQYEWSLVYAIIKPYVRLWGNRVFIINKEFQSAIIKSLSDEKTLELRIKIINCFTDYGDMSEKFDEYPYQLAKTKQIETLLNYLINLDVFHYAFKYRYSDILKYWGGLDDEDELEYFDYYVFLEGAGLDTLLRYLDCPPPESKNVSKVVALKEIMEFIEFTLKPLSYIKYNLDRINDRFAEKIIQEIKQDNKFTNIQKADFLLSCSMVLGDNYEHPDDYLKQAITFLEPELTDLLKFHEVNIMLKRSEGNINMDMNINYLDNLLNTSEKLSNVFFKWVSANNELLNHLSKKKEVENCYNAVVTSMDKISDILKEQERINILTALEYSYGMWLHNHKKYFDAQKHLHKSFILRLQEFNDNVSYNQKERLYENYKLINSCQCRTNEYILENQIIYANAIEKFSPSYLPKYAVGECIMNCAASFYNKTVSETIENDVKEKYLRTAIMYYEKSLGYLDNSNSLESALKAHFFISICKVKLDEDYSSNWKYILEHIDSVNNPNPMTLQIKQIIKDSSI